MFEKSLGNALRPAQIANPPRKSYRAPGGEAKVAREYNPIVSGKACRIEVWWKMFHRRVFGESGLVKINDWTVLEMMIQISGSVSFRVGGWADPC